MITIEKFEKEIKRFKEEGLLSESFRLVEYNEGAAIGMDDDYKIIYWTNLGSCFVLRRDLRCTYVVWDEEKELPIFIKALGIDHCAVKLKIF